MAMSADDIFEVRTTGTQTGGALFRWVSLRSTTYKWTASASGTGEYYCQTAAGGNPGLTSPGSVYLDGDYDLATNGVMGSLAVSEWDWGDNDALGYSTVYVRLADSADPDTKNPGFVGIAYGGGTDYSQQDAPQYDITNASAAGAGNTITTASAAADMVGNGLFAVGGTNVRANKRYEITSVVVGTSITVTGSGTLMSGAGAGDVHVHIGGAFQFSGTLDDDFTEDLVAGNTVYVESGTYTLGEAVSQAIDGTAGTPITWRGYIGTRNAIPTGDDRPLFDVTTLGWSSGDYALYEYLRFTGTVNGSTFQTGNYGWAYKCKFNNTSGSAGKVAVTTKGGLYNCEISSTLGTAVSNSYGYQGLYQCYIHDSSIGVYQAASIAQIVNCVIDTCTTGFYLYDVGSSWNAEVNVFGNVFYNCTNPIDNTSGSGGVYLNNIVTSCTNELDISSYNKRDLFDYNCWNCTNVNAYNRKGPNDITEDPLLNAPATGDFTLQAASPCANAGLKVDTLTGASADCKTSIGVDQPGTGAGGIKVPRGMRGGFN